jgi:hypothetical protein
MAYVVRNSNNNIVATVADNTVDNTTTIQLIGKNYVGYGAALNQNLVRMLEHFAKTSSPNNPITGQIWFDTTTSDLKVYNGSSFVHAVKTVANLSGGNLSASGTITATGNVSGSQLLSTVADGTPPIVIASSSRVANLNAAVAGTLLNGNSNVSIAANSFVTVSVAGTANVVNVAATGVSITGNANISVDANIVGNIIVTSNANIGGNIIVTSNANIGGTANITGNANVGNVGTGTIIATTANLTTINSGKMQSGNSNVGIVANGNITITATSNSTVTVTGTGANIAGYANITGNANVGNLGTAGIVSTANNAGTLISITDSNSVVSSNKAVSIVAGTSNFFIVPNSASGAYNALVSANDILLGFNGQSGLGSGNLTIAPWATTSGGLKFVVSSNVTTILSSSNVIPSANATYTLGNTTNRWSNIWGLASSAQYADLAEKYRSDADYVPGTVLELGGAHEITVCNTPRSDRVFGCVSTDPAYLMNDNSKEGIWLPVVLVGRAPIRVAGPVSKGDRLVSAGNGAAMAAGAAGSSYQTEIGRALETKTTADVGLIQAYINTK